MDCWIDSVDTRGQRLIRISGRLSAAQVPDLVKLHDEAGDRPVVVDLADLINADAIGIHALQQLQHRGATLIQATQYIKLKLDLPTP